MLKGNLSNPKHAGSLEEFAFATPPLPDGQEVVK